MGIRQDRVMSIAKMGTEVSEAILELRQNRMNRMLEAIIGGNKMPQMFIDKERLMVEEAREAVKICKEREANSVI